MQAEEEVDEASRGVAGQLGRVARALHDRAQGRGGGVSAIRGGGVERRLALDDVLHHGDQHAAHSACEG